MWFLFLFLFHTICAPPVTMYYTQNTRYARTNNNNKNNTNSRETSLRFTSIVFVCVCTNANEFKTESFADALNAILFEIGMTHAAIVVATVAAITLNCDIFVFVHFVLKRKNTMPLHYTNSAGNKLNLYINTNNLSAYLFYVYQWIFRGFFSFLFIWRIPAANKTMISILVRFASTEVSKYLLHKIERRQIVIDINIYLLFTINGNFEIYCTHFVLTTTMRTTMRTTIWIWI